MYIANNEIFINAKPFLKWAGGKKQLISELDKRLPQELKEGRIKRYIEPFIGAGALLFHVANNYRIDEFIIGDINKDLIVCYISIQKNPEKVIKTLSNMQNEYRHLNPINQSEFYYQVRNEYNTESDTFNYMVYDDDWSQRTAKTIFLNRTCFNGLFRVNSKGKFNVPFGRYSNPYIFDTENIYQVSSVLNKTKIVLGDFELVSDYIDKDTFVYLDPPYRPISQTSRFTSYNGVDFNDSDQIRLFRFYYQMSNERKAKLMLSNSDPQNSNARDNFFDDMYKNFEIDRVKACRMINCNGMKRGLINEIIVINY